MTSLTILPPRVDQSRYEYFILYGAGQKTARAWLTYDLQNKEPTKRRFLLTDNPQVVPPALRESFDNFKTAIPKRTKDRVNQAKSIVNQIRANPNVFPNCGIAVHKFGPVPVFVLPDTISIGEGKSQIDAHIAIYPFRRDLSQNSDSRFLDIPQACPNLAHFRESMLVHPTIVFRRYFEDAAEDMLDIANHLPLNQGISRAKRIESTMGRSVGSKLKMLVPRATRPEKIGNDKNIMQIWSCFDELGPVLYEATLARQFGLLLINRFYALQGLAPEMLRYLERIELLSAGFSDRMSEEDIKVCHLRGATKTLYRYVELLKDPIFTLNRASTLEQAESILKISSSCNEDWLRRFGEFAAFLKYVEATRQEPSRVRIFVSQPFDVPVVDELKNRIELFLKGNLHGIAGTPISRFDTDVRFRHLIRAAIWDSEITLAVVPKSTSTSTTDEGQKSYQWIGIEVDHALQLDKDVSFWVEQGTDITSVSRELAIPPYSFLTSDWRQESQTKRAEYVARLFEEYNHAQFHIAQGSIGRKHELDSSLKDRLEALTSRAVEKRARGLLSGILSQVDPPHRRTLLEVLSVVLPRRPLKIERIAEELAITYPYRHLSVESAKGAIAAMWMRVKTRGVEVRRRDGRPAKVSLLRIYSKKRRYYSPLLSLAGGYLPYKKQTLWKELTGVLNEEYTKANRDEPRFCGKQLAFRRCTF